MMSARFKLQVNKPRRSEIEACETPTRWGRGKVGPGTLLCIIAASLGIGIQIAGQARADLPWAAARFAAATVAAAADEVSNVPADKVRVEDRPEKDGWDTEAFNNVAGGQLKELGKLLLDPADTSDAKFGALVTAQFTCVPLRPANLREVYRDKAVTVLRGETDAAAAAGAARGGPALREALPGLASSFKDLSGVRYKFKIVRVDAAEAVITTSVMFEISGLGASGGLQQVAWWTCVWTRPAGGEAPLLKSIRVDSFEEVVTRSAGRVLLGDATESVLGGNAIFARQLIPGSNDWLARIDASIAMTTFGHQGIAVADVNGDGLEDVYVCQSAGLPNLLFIQNADGTATDAAAAAGVDWLEPSYGCLLIDLDNDGSPDLVIATDTHLVVMSNDGRGKFTLRAQLPTLRPAYSLAAADVDNDGKLDVYACVYHDVKANPGQLAEPVPYHDARNGGRNILFHTDHVGDGNWKFSDITNDVGLDENNTRWSFAASWEDFDGDGLLDLCVANDFGRKNLYRNVGTRQKPRFKDVAPHAGVEDQSFGMSSCWGDYNRDGKFDLYFSNMWSSAGNRVTFQRQFKQNLPEGMKTQFQYLARGNSLFQNAGDGTFKDVSVDTGVTMGRWAWCSQFFDINNDGWEDLFITNGWVTNELPDDL